MDYMYLNKVKVQDKTRGGNYFSNISISIICKVYFLINYLLHG